MYVELDEKEYELMKEVQSITCTNYELKGNLIDKDGLICALEELVWEVHRLEEEIERQKEDIRDNYKRISDYDFYGVSESDFI